MFTMTSNCGGRPNRLLVLRYTYVKAAMTRAGRAISKPAPCQRWATLFALLAFLLQGLAVQTHIHEQPLATKMAALPGSSKAPTKSQDPVDQCRLCQELVHAGTFITPSAAIAPTGLIYVTAVFLVLTGATATSATAFAWQSRAPPRR
jgi:hypothetical protein